MAILEKVTVFITRPTDTGWAVLLLRHPYGGLQFPPGRSNRASCRWRRHGGKPPKKPA